MYTSINEVLQIPKGYRDIFNGIRTLALLFLLLTLSTHIFSQTVWYDHYTDAREAIRDARWQNALKKLQKAVKKKRNPQRNAETYALQFVDYLPYYWIGVCRFNLGEFDAAQEAFNKSRQWGAINRSRYNRTLEHYQAIIDSILLHRQRVEALADSLRQFKQLRQEQNLQHRQLLRFLAQLGEGRVSAARATLSEIEQRTPNSLLLPHLRGLLGETSAIVHREEAGSTPTGRDSLFEAGLRAYLVGSYSQALAAFNQVAANDPQYRQVNDWLRRTRAEMIRIGQAPDTQRVTIVERDTVTVAPLIAFSRPPATTRSEEISLRGTVSDDQGIDYLEIILNGEPLRNPDGQPLRITPSSPDQKQFDFEIRLPLRLGENQIVVSAQDRDPEKHQAVFPVRIVRLSPLYQTPLFWGTMLGILALIAAGFAINAGMKRRIAFVNRYNPYIAGAPIHDPKMFYGREQLLRRIINTLHNNSLMLHGPRRIGKTSLLHQLRQRLLAAADSQYRYIPVYIDLQGVPESRFFEVMMEDIIEGCKPTLPEFPELRFYLHRDGYSARDFNADIKTILTELNQQAQHSVKLVLLIDEVDQLNSYSEPTNQRLRSIFMKTFAKDLAAVMSGSYIRTRWESEGSPWYNFFEQIEIGPIGRKEAERLIREPARGIFSFDDEAVERIIAYSECIPYRIQRFCVNCIARIIEARRRKVTVSDVETVKSQVLTEQEQ